MYECIYAPFCVSYVASMLLLQYKNGISECEHESCIVTRGANRRVPHDMIITIQWLTIMIISRYSDSAIINIFLENPIMIHHDICLKKCL